MTASKDATSFPAELELRSLAGLPRRPTSSLILPDDRSYLGPRFDAEWYAARYAPLFERGSDPFTHYLSDGRVMGCRPNPDILHNIMPRDPIGFTPEKLREEVMVIEDAQVFDEAWYVSLYAIPIEDALEHYLLEGAFEGLDPNPFFSSKLYFHLHGDVAAAGVNPLWHYLVHGCMEGRPGWIKPHLLGSLDFGERVWAKGLTAMVDAKGCDLLDDDQIADAS